MRCFWPNEPRSEHGAVIRLYRMTAPRGWLFAHDIRKWGGKGPFAFRTDCAKADVMVLSLLYLLWQRHLPERDEDRSSDDDSDQHLAAIESERRLNREPDRTGQPRRALFGILTIHRHSNNAHPRRYS